jgi:hypothetical protein
VDTDRNALRQPDPGECGMIDERSLWTILVTLIGAPGRAIEQNDPRQRSSIGRAIPENQSSICWRDADAGGLRITFSAPIQIV